MVSEPGLTLDVDQGPGLLLHQPLTSIGVLDAWEKPCMKLGCRRRSKPPPADNHTGKPTHPSVNNPSQSTYTVDRSSCHCLSSPRERPRPHPRHTRQQASTPVLRKSGSAFTPLHDQPRLTPACDQIPQSEPPAASLRSSKPPSVSALARDPNPQSSTRACSIYTHQSPSAGNHTGDSTSNQQPRLDLYRQQSDISRDSDQLPPSASHSAMPSPAPLRPIFLPHTSTRAPPHDPHQRFTHLPVIIASLYSSTFSKCRNLKLLHEFRALLFNRSANSILIDKKAIFSPAWLTGWPSFSISGRWSNWMIGRRSFHIRASSSALESESSTDDSASIAPLQLESPVGQFLFETLLNYPHLVPAAIDQQLQLLQPAYEEDKSNDESSSSGTKLVLHRRIVELKANGRRRALICYSEKEKTGQLHSHESYEMSKNHLALILVLPPSLHRPKPVRTKPHPRVPRTTLPVPIHSIVPARTIPLEHPTYSIRLHARHQCSSIFICIATFCLHQLMLMLQLLAELAGAGVIPDSTRHEIGYDVTWLFAPSSCLLEYKITGAFSDPSQSCDQIPFARTPCFVFLRTRGE